MASQRVPAGNLVAVVANGGGAGAHAADACAEAGLAVAATCAATRGHLREVLPVAAFLDGPVETTAAVSPEAFGEVVRIAAAQDGVAALIAVIVRSASADLLPALTAMPTPPSRQRPHSAATWCSRPTCPACCTRPRSASSNWTCTAPGEVRAAMLRLQGRFAGPMSGVPVEPMITGGIETIVGVVQEPVFGPLVVFGLGGVATEVLADHAALLTPLTDTDADGLIRSIKAAPLLLGHRGSPPADLQALRDLLLRVSRLADDLPEITDLDLNPVIARPDGVFVVDARVKAAPSPPQDPFLRRLP